ncbi:MAG: hypothetical protein M1826_001880 [Phylliscum demangeonii]|nr:MAG: hypothetical protein M1826_001880 [Phylliscum demangeonii]
MDLPKPASPLALNDFYRARFEASVRNGEVSLFLYPQQALSAFLLVVYLLIPHRKYPIVRYARLPIFFIVLYFQISTIRHCRSAQWAAGFGSGIISAWAILWVATLMVFSDPQRDFCRIQKGQEDKAKEEKENESLQGEPSDGPVFSSAVEQPSGKGEDALRMEHESWRHGSSDDVPSDAHDGCAAGPPQGRQRTEHSISRRGEKYYWQAFPAEHFLERLDWVVDLVTNLRGLGWKHQAPALLGPPRHIQTQLGFAKIAPPEDVAFSVGSTGNRTYYEKGPLLRQKLATFAVSYVLVDLCKVLMMRDHYFWGLVDSPAPAYLPQLIRDSPSLVKSYRLILSLAGVDLSLELLFSLGPLFFVGILGSRFFQAQAEPWMYPDMFGSFGSVLEKGLAGWWGGWWHQIFRFAFAAPSSWMIKQLGIDKRSNTARTVRLVVAFTLSGCLHASGSYTQLLHTRPLAGPFCFFFVQSLGISLEMIVKSWLARSEVARRCPRLVRQAINFVYVHVWFYYTAPLLTDDVARGGVWLFELIPISLLRGFGFGLKEEGWWCWHYPLLHWHRGTSWWNSGLSL